MYSIYQKWDIEFFSSYIPVLVSQLQKNTSIFQSFIHCLSQFHHRVASLIIEQPPRFKIAISEQLWKQIKNIIEDIQNKNQNQLLKLNYMCRQLKKSISNLVCQFKDNQTKLIQIQTNKSTIETTYQKYCHQLNQISTLSEHQQLTQCPYSKPKYLIDVFPLDQNTNKYLSKLNKIKTELTELNQKQQLYYYQQNNLFRVYLQKVNHAINQIIKYKKQSKFETFNRDYYQTKIQKQQNKLENSAKISQFIDDDIHQIIKQAQINCERDSYMKIKVQSAQKILEGAILAVSKDQESYEEDSRIGKGNDKLLENYHV